MTHTHDSRWSQRMRLFFAFVSCIENSKELRDTTLGQLTRSVSQPRVTKPLHELLYFTIDAWDFSKFIELP